MDIFGFGFTLVIVLAVLIPIALIFLLIRVADLRSRIVTLEYAARQSLAGNTPAAGASPPAPVTPQTQPETLSPPVPEVAPDLGPATNLPPPIPAMAAGRPRDPFNPGRMVADASANLPPATPPPLRGPGLAERFAEWIAGNWFYAVSAVSLALAGLFMVQYGIENGLIPPGLRVLAALVFGAALIGAGEYIRRRWGDRDEATAYLPSVFSGAGIVSLFGGILSARLMYGMIGPEVALVGMVAVAILAMGLGWLHGPLLAAAGVLGGFVAPMIVGGSSEDPTWLYAYFAVIAALGLGIDTLRRWAWVSGLSLGLGILMGWILYLSDSSTSGAHILYAFVLAMLAVLIPARSITPDQSGPALWHALRGKGWPMFPTYLAAAGLASASWTITAVAGESDTAFWLALVVLSVLGLAWILWSETAPALQDQALFPLAALFYAVVAEGRWGTALVRPLPVIDPATGAVLDPAYPVAVTALVFLGGLWSLAAAWRSWRGGELAVVWAGAAALIAPGLAILLEVFWTPAYTMGAYPWALHAAALAAGMVFLAERFSRADGPADRMRVALFTLSALSALTFAFVIVLSTTALTLAIAVTVVAAAWLDRRFDLAPMAAFIAAGVLTIGYRLMVNPGLAWAFDAQFFDVVLAYGGAFAAMLAALWLMQHRARDRNRDAALVTLDSAVWSLGGLFASVMLYRVIDAALGGNNTNAHWAFGLFATIWFGMALAQMNIATSTAPLRWLRFALALAFGLIGSGGLLLGLTIFSPLISEWGGRVGGPALLNTLIPAYLLPGLVLLIGSWKIRGMAHWVRLGLGGLGLFLGGYWLFTAIRQFWQGSRYMELWRGFTQPEISTYTVAVLLIGAGLFYQSLAKRSRILRRAGLVVIGLAVAKVFLIDIGSLGGLIRVFSFLLLGFALAGLAWLNAWAQRNEVPTAAEPPPIP